MQGYITKIEGLTPYTNLPISILLNGKNLIITGRNGSGKTSFLTDLRTTLNKQIKAKKDDQQKQQLTSSVPHWESQLATNPKGSSNYAQAKDQLNYLYKQLAEFNLPFILEYTNQHSFSASIDDSTGIIEFFEASRQAKITHTTSAQPFDEDQTKQEVHNLNNNGSIHQLGNSLEQYLLNLYIRLSLAQTHTSEINLAPKIERWLTEFNNNLKFLIEDESARLEFDANKLKVSIHQDNKKITIFSSYPQDIQQYLVSTPN